MASTIEVDQIKHSSGVAFTLPTADGTAGQLLKTDGSLTLGWATDADTGITSVAADTSPQLGGFLDCNGNYIQMQKGGDIASASPTVIDTDGDYFICTGTTGFTTFTVAADRHFFLEFAGALTMTHGAGTLDLPGGANITTAAGDVGEFVSTASNVVTCVNYTRAGGIVNADINASAAIAQSKLVDIVNADIDASAAIAQSKLVDIVNADVDASAAIATSKLSGAVTSIGSHGLATSATTDTTNASNIGSGTLPNARLSSVPTSSLTGAVTSIGSHGLATSATTDMTDMGNAASGTLAVARGGTGTTTYTALMNAIYDGTPDSDHTVNGPQTNTFASGYSSAIGDLVYLGSDGEWYEADSDATGTSINLLGIALETKTDGQAMNVALPGSFVRDDSAFAFTPGVPLYVSGTLGAITATKPTGSGDVVRTVGYAVHADMIYFNPSSDYVTLA